MDPIDSSGPGLGEGEMNEGEGEAIRTWKPEFERLISNLLSKNCGETPADPAALALLEDVGLSLLFNILGEADGIARFKNASNIGGDHVRVAVDLIGARMNLMREDDNSIADTASIVKPSKTHQLNTDESIVSSKTQENVLLEKTKHLAEVVVVQEKVNNGTLKKEKKRVKNN